MEMFYLLLWTLLIVALSAAITRNFYKKKFNEELAEYICDCMFEDALEKYITIEKDFTEVEETMKEISEDLREYITAKFANSFKSDLIKNKTLSGRTVVGKVTNTESNEVYYIHIDAELNPEKEKMVFKKFELVDENFYNEYQKEE